MKNNEILVSVKFNIKNRVRTLSFLVVKDITLKEFIQGVYYGLKNFNPDESIDADTTLSIQDCFQAFEQYIKTHCELLILYTIMGEYSKVDITEQSMDVLDQQKKVKNNYDLSLSSLGIVTSSEFFITDNDMVTNVPQLFDKGDREKTYILRDNNTLEYNISTRRLNVIEPTVIDILPAGDMPTKAKGSLLDTIAPPLITGLGMVGIRFFISQFSSNSGLNDSMLAMTIAMPFMSAVTSLYKNDFDGCNQ